MNRPGTHLDADIVIAGSGPGGATVARQLARAGRCVILLERGRDHRGRFYYGTYLGALRYTDRARLLFTREGLNICFRLGRRRETECWLADGWKVACA